MEIDGGRHPVSASGLYTQVQCVPSHRTCAHTLHTHYNTQKFVKIQKSVLALSKPITADDLWFCRMKTKSSHSQDWIHQCNLCLSHQCLACPALDPILHFHHIKILHMFNKGLPTPGLTNNVPGTENSQCFLKHPVLSRCLN